MYTIQADSGRSSIIGGTYHLLTEGSITATRTIRTIGTISSRLNVTSEVSDMVRPRRFPQTVMSSRITVARAAFLHPEGRLEDSPNNPASARKNRMISTK